MSQNPYQPVAGYGSIAADAGVDARTEFIKKTYLHLLGAILAFAAIDSIVLMVFGKALEPVVLGMMGGYMWLVVLGAFMFVSWIANSWAHNGASREKQYLGLGLYVLAEAIIFLPLLFVANRVAPGAIQSAGIMTLVVFGGLSLTVLVTKADFSFLRWAIVAGSFIAFGLIVASIVMGGAFPLGLWFSVAMIVLACGIILYTTSQVLHDYRTDQYVAASLALFAAIALLFWYMIQLFMSFDD